MLKSSSHIHWGAFLIAVAGTYFLAADLIAAPHGSNVSRRITANWQGQELGVVLERISLTSGSFVWIDRRTDPQQLVNAQFTSATLPQVFDQLAKSNSLRWSAWEGIVYVGSRSADEVATLLAIGRDKASRLPPETRERWLRVESTTWSRLSDPREILTSWLKTSDIRLSGLELLSHDLWETKRLPPMPLVDRVTLLLAGFGMTCDISPDGKTCHIVRIEQPVKIVREYDAGNRARQLVEEYRTSPRVAINRRGDKVQIAGRWEDHQRAKEILGGTSTRGEQRRSTPRSARNVFSLRMENQPVGKVIDQLARQLGLEVVWKADVEDRNTLVSCEVSDGTLSELLTAVLNPAGLEFELKEKRLEVAPRR